MDLIYSSILNKFHPNVRGNTLHKSVPKKHSYKISDRPDKRHVCPKHSTFSDVHICVDFPYVYIEINETRRQMSVAGLFFRAKRQTPFLGGKLSFGRVMHYLKI